MGYPDGLQWPAMALAVFATWLVGSRQRPRSNGSFWRLPGSDVFWSAWGWHDSAYALIVFQIFLVNANVRGVLKIDPG